MTLRTLSIFIALFIVAVVPSKANDGLFSFDRNAVDAAMAPLSKIETHLEQNGRVSFDELKAQNPGIIADANFESDNSFLSSLTEGPAGIPSFLWGCILSWIGILIVYLITEDSEETKKALYGCIVGAISGCILYFVFWLLFWGAAWGSFWWY